MPYYIWIKPQFFCFLFQFRINAYFIGSYAKSSVWKLNYVAGTLTVIFNKGFGCSFYRSFLTGANGCISYNFIG